MEEAVNDRPGAGGGQWDSPLGGAYLIWRFVRGFVGIKEKGPNMLLLFPALAILMTPEFSSGVSKGGSLADFAYAFLDSSGKKAKSLAGLQRTTLAMREWTLRSLEFAMVTRLVEMCPDDLSVTPLLKDELPVTARFARAFKREEGERAGALGSAFARTPEGDIPYYLGVKF